MSIISMIDEVYRVESLHVMMVADARVGDSRGWTPTWYIEEENLLEMCQSFTQNMTA
jgi:hypothetical protein